MSLRNPRIAKALAAAALAAATVAGLALAAPAVAHAADVPTADNYEVGSHVTLHVGAELGVKANDGPASVPFIVKAMSSASRGTARLAEDGSFDYTSDVGFVGTDTFSYCLIAAVGTPCITAEIPVNIAVHGVIERVGGADRYEVSAAVSASSFPKDVPVAYVASGAVFSDALSASAAAGAQKAPVLLIEKNAVPPTVAAELTRLHPGKIVMLGGFMTLTADVQVALRKYSGTVERIDGPDRFAVSAAVSRSAFAPAPAAVFIASGEVFPDALSGSAAAGFVGGPLLLVSKNAVPGEVATELARLNPTTISVLGGANSVSDATVDALQGPGRVVLRLSGADRYEVSAKVSANIFNAATTNTVYVASGAVFPDALSGSAAAIAAHAPVLLVSRDAIPPSVVTELDRLQPTRIVVLGGENTISGVTNAELQTHLKH